MNDRPFAELNQLAAGKDPGAVLERLISHLREEKDYHRLFDALLLQRKYELGLSLARPTSLEDVPAEQRRLVEETYISAAREVGLAFIDKGDLPVPGCICK